MNYTYDAANGMATVTDWLSAVTTYAYDDAGRLVSTTYPNGVVGTKGYDAADRLTSVTNSKAGTFSSFNYTLDAAGNRTQAVVTGGGAGTHAYTLDNLYRLTSVTYPGAVTDTYTYDQLGNRLTKNATSYTYDNADELTAAGGTSYTYDLSGNQLTRGADTFTWDHENRLTQSVVGGVTSSSVYYGNGVRRSHTVNGVTTTYTYDVASSLPVVLQDGTNSLVYGLDLISSTDGAGNRTYFSYDGLGSTSDLTDAAGNVTDTYSYDVFGAVRARTGTNASVWKFTGEQEDGTAGDLGYYSLRARYLDVATGRFVSRDPLEFDQRYAYAGGNPVLHADPSGECPICIPIVVGVIVGGYYGANPPCWECNMALGQQMADNFTGNAEALRRWAGTWFAKPNLPEPAFEPDFGGGEPLAGFEKRERNWYDPELERTLSPDDSGHGPHFDYQRRGFAGKWRLYPDGRKEWVPK